MKVVVLLLMLAGVDEDWNEKKKKEFYVLTF